MQSNKTKIKLLFSFLLIVYFFGALLSYNYIQHCVSLRYTR